MLCENLHRLRSDVKNAPAGWDRIDADGAPLRLGIQSIRNHDINRQDQPGAAVVQQCAGLVEFIIFY